MKNLSGIIRFAIGVMVVLSIFPMLFNFNVDFSFSNIITVLVVISVISSFLNKGKKYTKDKDNEYQSQESRYQACPTCGSLSYKEESGCGHCGYTKKNEVVCDYCGALNSPDDLMCSKCNGLLK